MDFLIGMYLVCQSPQISEQARKPKYSSKKLLKTQQLKIGSRERKVQQLQ